MKFSKRSSSVIRQLNPIIKMIVKRLICLIINFILLIISFFIPKTEKIMVVGGWYGRRFADNSKFFFLYANANKHQLNIDKIIWVTRQNSIIKELREQGYHVYHVWSIFSIWYHLRAKTHLIDQSITDINPFFSIRSRRINLWHGFPLKKIGTYTTRSSTHFLTWLNKATLRGFWGFHYVLATSSFSSDILGKAFNQPNKSMVISSYPRNYEPVVNKPIKYVSKNEQTYLNHILKAKENNNKIIGYFPTFRDKRETFIFGTSNLEELTRFLDDFKEKKIMLVGKFHYVGKEDKFGDITRHEVFLNLPSDVDVYTFISELDILITDYSSIYFDFLMWKRPIIFFPYDLEYYRDEDRGFIFDYEEYTPGPKIFTIDELNELLEHGVENFQNTYNRQFQTKASELSTKIFAQPEKMLIDHLINQIRSLKNII